ncbi:GIY-YIG nuclease family protein [Mycoplasmopsis verecunda]|uniref:Excinuclease cho n=1 Tax=Mycoplasmopsis verecunda TaxID=171291 RepID=A0A1T4LE36_9BACT|nr:GIY-YIG nuclease family protein [Mycoplasmopsis verecunda]WPB54322.1 GIY-YIG nuclease family protein [Mycoplasmopsis verecunda]SJZ52818.1 Excinuclease ABC subunit C [Mycoplasmopsis verecunda]
MNSANRDKIEEKIKNIPHKPGVYLWKNSANEVIYVGKAKDLRKRLSNYLNGSLNSYKTPKMLQEAIDFEVFITNTENDSFLLENNYIKQYSPKYNIKLQDDRHYPYLGIKIQKNGLLSIDKEYRIKNKTKDTYYYGPFSTNSNLEDLVDILQRNFTYQDGLVIKQSPYAESLKKYKKIIHILKFSDNDFINQLTVLRDKNSKLNNFELAQQYHNTIQTLQKIKQSQVVELETYKNIDVFSFKKINDDFTIQIVFYRYGIQVGSLHFFCDSLDLQIQDFIAEYLNNYYRRNIVPNNILLDEEYRDLNFEDAFINNIIIFPKSGILKEVITLANINNENNIKLNYNEWKYKHSNTQDAWDELESILNNGNPIKEIFIFDNSHSALKSSGGVACCWQNAKQIEYKSFSFNHEVEFAQMNKHSDVQLMYLTVFKFINEYSSNLDKNTIFIVDGAIAQINEAKYALKENEIDYIKVYGLVKNDKHKTSYLINDANEILEISPKVFTLLSLMQKNVDDFAKSAMHKRYKANSRKNSLLNIKGIGQQTESKLLNVFKNYADIKNATYEQLAQVIDKKKAKMIYDEYHK